MVMNASMHALLGLTLIGAGSGIPSIDIARTCRATAAANSVHQCLSDERHARRRLARDWNRVPARAKRECVIEPLPPYPSYMVLRDCVSNYEKDHRPRT